MRVHMEIVWTKHIVLVRKQRKTSVFLVVVQRRVACFSPVTPRCFSSFPFTTHPRSLSGEGRGAEGPVVDSGAVPGSPLYFGMSDPEALRQGPVRRPAGVRSPVGGTAGRSHRDGHRAALGGG